MNSRLLPFRASKALRPFILATQSPLLLDEFEPQDVLAAGRNGHATVFQRLDAASLEDWLGEYSLGELWEKNEN